MVFRRVLTAMLLLTGIAVSAVALGGPATAAPYPPANPASLTASAYDPCAGASNVIGGNGFLSGETVRLVLSQTGEIARATAGTDGTFRITVTIPLSTRGSDQVLATGLRSGRTASLTLAIPCVVGQSNSSRALPSNGSLASTGAAIGGAVLVALVLFGTGAVLVVAGRRRRSHRTAH